MSARISISINLLKLVNIFLLSYDDQYIKANNYIAHLSLSIFSI